LIAPAAFHRITFGGQNTEEMHRIGSFLVTSAPLPLGLSIGANAYVAAVKITETPPSELRWRELFVSGSFASGMRCHSCAGVPSRADCRGWSRTAHRGQAASAR
jgi:hypothetical protein